MATSTGMMTCPRCHGAKTEPNPRLREIGRKFCWQCGGRGEITAIHPVRDLPVVPYTQPIEEDPSVELAYHADHLGVDYDITTGEMGQRGEVLV